MRRAAVITRLCLVLLVPTVALADIPSPTTSTVPALVGCPAGDLSFKVIVRDASFSPLPNYAVQIPFLSCPSYTLCALLLPGYDMARLTRTMTQLTGANGETIFAIHQGGVCSGTTVTANGVFLANRAFASADQDGDLQVTATDEDMVNAKLGTTDGTADFDGSGFVDTLDLLVVQEHLGHNCLGTVAVGPEGPIEFGVWISPNPASARAAIAYSVPAQGHVRLRVFDISGRTVATLVDGVVMGGPHTVTFDGTDKTGASLYFYTLEARGRRASGKFVLVK